MNEGCQRLAKHKADNTFQKCHICIGLIPAIKFGKSLLRDCSRYTLGHRIEPGD